MRLESVRLDRYGPIGGFDHEPTGGLEVLYGPNEAGKTLLLEGICRLLAPESAALFGASERVERDPVGAIEVRRDGECVTADGNGESGLVDDGLTARHLRNVFVIRDSDLRLADEHAFYDSVTEQIGDLHTGDLDALAEILKERGRLTDRTLALSTAADHDEAGDVRDAAAGLAEEIRTYVAEARDAGIEAAERRRIRVARELRRVDEALERQDRAETLHAHRELSAHLETYREAVEALANAAGSADERERLQALAQERRDAEREVEGLEDDLAETRAERQAERERLRELESELEGYRARESTVAEVRDQLVALDDDVSAPGADRLRRFAATMAVAGVLGGGVAAGLGARVVGGLALLVGLGAAGGWLWQYRRVAAAEREREALVAAAGTAALDVDGVGDVRAAVESFETELRRLDREREATAERVDHLDETIADLSDERDAARERADAAAAERDGILDAADVADVDAYADAVAEQQALARERDQSGAVLESRLPPDVDDATPGERIAAWEAAIEDVVADLEEGDGEDHDVDPDDYDPERKADLEADRADLAAERADLEDVLDEHEGKLDAFADRARDVYAEPFLDGRIELSARSLDGLAALATDCEELVATIDREADVAREAVDVLDAVRADEEAKIAALFGDDGRASEVLAAITDGRYTDVRYDADDRTLRVRRADGEGFEPAELSHGTVEQLYLAVRVALGEELLGHDPGFFLLDDAFLPADGERLERGFGVLERLADAGWQIVYLTAKPEVGEGMVQAYDLPVRELDGPV